MDRRTVVRITLGLVLTPLTVEAQNLKRMPVIGFLGSGSPHDAAAQSYVVEPFRFGLQALGYIEGKNVIIEFRWGEGKPERLADLAAELVRLNVDVILAAGAPAARAAKNATATIPIVFTSVGDAVAEGLVASLGRPGGNVTGLMIAAGVEIVGKRLQLLKEVVPAITRIGILWNSGNPSHPLVMKQIPAMAHSLGVELLALEAHRPEDFDAAFASLTTDRIGGLVALADPMFNIHAEKLVDFSARARVPTIYGSPLFVEAGGFMSYQGDLALQYRRSAAFVDRILKGANPADLPVEQSTKFELVINLKTAKALGITIPQSLVLRADKVIQ
jgi:putative ABC transport system substrate-binding protein